MTSAIQNANDLGSILSLNTSRYIATRSMATTSGRTVQKVCPRKMTGRVR